VQRSSNPKAESSQQFPSPKPCDPQGSTVEVLDQPFFGQRDFQEGCPQCPADMRPPLAPVEACARESAAQRPYRLEINTEGLKRIRSIPSQVVCVVASH